VEVDMDDRINDILCKLQSGKINVETATKEIDNIKYQTDKEIKPAKCARKIKIYINAIDEDRDGKNIKINLPALPLKFIKRLGVFGIKIAIKHSDKSKTNINLAEIEKIKYIFDALTLLPPFEIVNIDSKDAKVHIYTC